MTKLLALTTILTVLWILGDSALASQPTDTHMGKTAKQWHKVAVGYRVERDQARSRLGSVTRYARRLRRQLTVRGTRNPGLIAPPVYQIARAEAARLGVTGEAWACLTRLITRENDNPPSRWNPTRWNGQGSSAYGLPQALPGSKMASAGSDWAWNPATQVRWLIVSYVKRYGGSCGAEQFQRAHGYY